ncbi:serine/threonine-protein phosphatase 6 regulatory subunit 1-like protein, partial [Cricetulus griseus]
MDFQMQRMTSAFIDHFGFNDEEFGEQEESVNAPFDKTANITFSLNADDDNPNANLLEICYKDRIQQFDDEEEEEEGQGSAESDGEYGAWQGSQPARASHAGQPPGVRSGGSTDSEDDEDEEEEEEEDEGAAQAACGRASPPSFPSLGPQPPAPSWTATFEPVPTDAPTGPSVSKKTDMSSTQIQTSSPAHRAPQLRSQDPIPPSAPQEVTDSSKVAEPLAPCQALVSVADVQATLHGMCSDPSSLDSATRDPSTSVPAFEAQKSPQTVEGEKNPEPLGLPQSQSAQALETPNGSTPGGPISSGS